MLESETTGVMRILVDADSRGDSSARPSWGCTPTTWSRSSAWRCRRACSYPTVRDALPIHPTMAEFIPSVLGSLQPLD